MLLSRFWYVFLAIAVGAALAAALLAQSAVNAREEEAVGESLKRDAAMVDAMLRLEARSRLDRIAFISVDTKLGSLLKQATGTSDPRRLQDLHAAVKGLMQMHVGRIAEAGGQAGSDARELEPDIAFALDGDGRIIAQLGPLEGNPPGSSLATFPLVRRALQGYVRDDVWLYDRRVYRMAARPVFSGSEYAGAIVHGYRIEKGLLDKLTRSIRGASVAFFLSQELIGSRSPGDVAKAPQPGELSSALPQLARDARFKAGERSNPVALMGGGRAIFDHITGSAAAQGAGYVIARPLHPLTSPLQLIQQASQDEVRALPWPMIGAIAALLGGVGLLSIFLERDRLLKQLLRKTGELGSGDRDRLIVTEWSGMHRALADRINQAIEKAVDKAGERAPVARKKANLDDILGHTPASSVTPFFSFASEQPAGGGAAPAPAPAAKTAGTPPGASTGTSSAAIPAVTVATPAAAAASSASTVMAAAAVPAAPSAAKAAPPKPAAAPPPPRPAQAPPGASMAPPAAQLPMATFSLPPPSPSPPPAAPGPPAAPARAAGTKPEAEANADDAHWREVYEAYIATRKQCGEPTDNLNFEKFGVTLRKTRDQIIDKQGVKTVRFSVQVKEGKAALKAQPIKR